MKTMREVAAGMKAVSARMANQSLEKRNQALAAIADALEANQAAIYEANAADLKKAMEDNLPDPVIKRLRFDEHKLADVTKGLRD